MLVLAPYRVLSDVQISVDMSDVDEMYANRFVFGKRDSLQTYTSMLLTQNLVTGLARNNDCSNEKLCASYSNTKTPQCELA